MSEASLTISALVLVNVSHHNHFTTAEWLFDQRASRLCMNWSSIDGAVPFLTPHHVLFQASLHSCHVNSALRRLFALVLTLFSRVRRFLSLLPSLPFYFLRFLTSSSSSIERIPSSVFRMAFEWFKPFLHTSRRPISACGTFGTRCNALFFYCHLTHVKILRQHRSGRRMWNNKRRWRPYVITQK